MKFHFWTSGWKIHLLSLTLRGGRRMRRSVRNGSRRFLIYTSHTKTNFQGAQTEKLAPFLFCKAATVYEWTAAAGVKRWLCASPRRIHPPQPPRVLPGHARKKRRVTQWAKARRDLFESKTPWNGALMPPARPGCTAGCLTTNTRLLSSKRVSCVRFWGRMIFNGAHSNRVLASLCNI